MPPPNTEADPILKRVREELRAAFGDRLARVVLYGSRARGDFHEDSDWDIAVFLDPIEDRGAEAERLAEIMHRLLLDTGELVSFQAFPIERLGERTFFMADVRREGVSL